MLVAAFIVMLGNVALVSPAHAFIYWTQSIPVGGTSWIARANLDGTGIDMKYLQASLGGTVAAANGYLYWTNPSAQTIGRADIRRGYTDQRFVQGTGAGVLGIVVGSSAMYWMRTTIRATLPTGPELTARIGRATIDGGNVDQNFITTNSDLYDPPADFAIGGPYLFWHWPIDDLLTDHLMRANLDGTGASVSIATFNSSLKDGLEGLTADTRQLYGVGYAGALIRMSFDGTTLSYGAPYVINRGGPMVVSGSHLYWQTENEIDGSVGIGVALSPAPCSITASSVISLAPTSTVTR